MLVADGVLGPVLAFAIVEAPPRNAAQGGRVNLAEIFFGSKLLYSHNLIRKFCAFL